MRPYIVEYLHSVVFGADHSNILEDFLYYAFRSEQFIAMTRANAVIDLVISRPMRWLSGSSYLLENWSPSSMGRALDLVEQLLVKAEADGSVLLDASLVGPDGTLFKEIADEQPLFHEYLKYMYEEETVVGPDGVTKHLCWQLARDEIFTPTDATNATASVKQRVIEYLEVQATAGLRKLHDPKLAIAKHLTSQEGSCAYDESATVHADTMGLDATNDRLAESVFGAYDYAMKRCPNISMEAASTMAQAMRAKSFAKGGYFHELPLHEQQALQEMLAESHWRALVTVLPQRSQADRAAEARHSSISQVNAAAKVVAATQPSFNLNTFLRWSHFDSERDQQMRFDADAFGSGWVRGDFAGHCSGLSSLRRALCVAVLLSSVIEPA